MLKKDPYIKDPYYEIKRKEREEKFKKKSDKFWSAFRLTEKGHVKSTLMLNSFCLGIVFAIVYVAAYFLLIDPIHNALSWAPPAVENLVGVLVSSALGTLVCSTSWLVFNDKRTMFCAYIWIAVVSLAVLITMLIMIRNEPEQIKIFLYLFMLLVPGPVLIGGTVAVLLYYRYWKDMMATLYG